MLGGTLSRCPLVKQQQTRHGPRLAPTVTRWPVTTVDDRCLFVVRFYFARSLPAYILNADGNQLARHAPVRAPDAHRLSAANHMVSNYFAKFSVSCLLELGVLELKTCNY